MNISLNRTIISKVAFEVLEGKQLIHNDKNRGRFNLSFNVSYPDDRTQFIVEFHIDIIDSENLFDLKMALKAYFNTNEEITEDFKSSHFPNVNAPAIAFPFLRSHVAHFTLEAGINPVMLPTINFTTFNDERKKESDNPIV